VYGASNAVMIIFWNNQNVFSDGADTLVILLAQSKCTGRQGRNIIDGANMANRDREVKFEF